MGDASKAVFLSYASQDTAAARRIADALRAVGVEVWFDQSELVGGDAWDHKIRRQIKDCALLIPIISAATQARTEGYFRLEWRLADQRTHLMAKGRPFLLPVVIDETRDSEAHVPESFLEVQWTRLPGGETTPAFASRVAKLLSGDMATEGSRSTQRTSDAAKVSAERGNSTSAATTSHRPAWLRYAWVAVGMILALFYGLKPLWRSSRGEPKPSATTESTAAVSPARKLANQARALIDDDPLAVRENFLTAKRLGERAIDLDPGDAEAYAVTARAWCELILEYQDRSPASLVAARSRAESAIRLAPDSVEAALALASVDAISGSRPAEVQHSLEALLARVPNDRRVFHLLQFVAMRLDHAEDAQKWVDRATALPGGDPESLNYRVGIFWGQNNYPQMAATLEQSLAQRTTASACHFKLMLLVWGWGDLPAGRAWVEQMPAALLQEDRVAMLAYLTWYWSRQSDRALEVLQRYPRPFIEQGSLFVSTDYLAGNAQLLAGHAEVAKVAFAAGLKAVNERLAAEPNNPRYLFEKTRLLARLGQRAESEQSLRMLRELAGPNAALMQIAEILVLNGAYDEAIAAAGRSIDRSRSRWPVAVNHLRLDPMFDPLRADPRFQAIVAKGEAQLAELRAGGVPNPGAAAPAPASAVTDQKSVAVLPFENRSAGAEDSAFLADGIHEDLINTLSRVPGLKVMSRTAVQQFRGAETPMGEIVSALKVSHVVEAGVQRAGNQVRINVQLVSATDGQTVWSERYDRVLTADGIFALQEEITAAIAKALKLQLDPGQGGVLIAGTTRNLEAYEAFLKGRQLWKSKLDSGADQEAVTLFQRAVALDPDFALAHGAMAEAYISLGNDGKVPPAKAFPLAKASAERALAIDPHCIQAITALGEYAFHYEWDYAQSERLLRQALEVDPNYAIVYSRLSGHLRMLNHADEAKVLELRESDLQPERPQVRQLNELKALVTAKQFNAAVATARQLASQMTDGYFGSYLLGDTLRQAGQWAEAVQQLEKAVDQYPDEIRLLEALGMTYAGMGQSDKARGVLVRMSAIQETRFVSPLSFAHVAGAMGDRDLAFSEIERAMHLRDPFLPSVGMDEGLAPIKGDPRYRDVLKRLKLDAYFPEVARQ